AEPGRSAGSPAARGSARTALVRPRAKVPIPDYRNGCRLIYLPGAIDPRRTPLDSFACHLIRNCASSTFAASQKSKILQAPSKSLEFPATARQTRR
ncbi:hypothetical protein, partial [Burkholderia sp. Cy-647]|uniref:hypothetical protein n=1 Tax=Burkholderia sp. Cy-647 TaxID=2608328 RepID=UPI001966BDC1